MKEDISDSQTLKADALARHFRRRSTCWDIVAYEQPVFRSDVAHIRGTDSAGVIDTLLVRKLIADDARFGGRGRPSFIVTTDASYGVLAPLLNCASMSQLG
jgi:hypothetical protein